MCEKYAYLIAAITVDGLEDKKFSDVQERKKTQKMLSNSFTYGRLVNIINWKVS